MLEPFWPHSSPALPFYLSFPIPPLLCCPPQEPVSGFLASTCIRLSIQNERFKGRTLVGGSMWGLTLESGVMSFTLSVSSSIHLLWISWFHFSLRLSNSALCISTSSSPTPTDGYLGSLHSLAAENRAATNMAKQASPQLESLSGAWLGVGELGHMEVPFLTLWENLHGFPVAVLVPTSTNTVATPVATCSSQPSHSDLKPFLETYL